VLTIATDATLTSIRIYDFNHKEWILSQDNLKQIDIRDLPKGIYILQAINESGKLYNTKFLKQ